MKAAARARIALVDDHWMFRESLASLINGHPRLQVCAEADSLQQGCQICRDHQPDLALVDVTLKGSSGLELIKQLRAEASALPVLVLSMHEESLYAERVLEAGGQGYITKHENSDTLFAAIETVLAGEVYLSARMTSAILKKVSGVRATTSGIHCLADRELEVFQMIGQGRATREIAEHLGLGVTTIDTYRCRIKEKLGLRSSIELQHRAVQWQQRSEAEKS